MEDDDLAAALDEPLEETEPLGPLPDVAFMCEHVDVETGEVCGYIPPSGTLQGLRAHKMGVHRDRSKDRNKGGRPPGRKNAAEKKPTRKKSPTQTAADSAAAPDTNRAATYTASIAMAALGAHLAIPRFDRYDLEVVNNGAPNLGAALDAVGAQNPTVRKTCDLILGGGAGGAYLQLLMACSAIAMPIMAHHGVVPISTGQRFGDLAGVTVTSPGSGEAASTPPPVAPDQAPGMGHPSTWTAEDLMAVVYQVQPNVLADLSTKMMSGVGPTVVGVPTMMTDEMPPTWAQREEDNGRAESETRETGSEQLAPEPVTVPA